ncbi:MAG TPA: right-handed parallel beta-helix repeat-containing protein [Terriglobia bacterium]|nr:right-handed parallel beta-helix repeat-containing protein [Terriglobia bacterium]
MCNRIQSRCLGTMLFGVATVLLLAVSPAMASTPITPIDPADGCAQTLGTAGEYVLTGDLNCSGTFGNGINITASNVIFHLAGHTISSTDCDLTRAISGISVPGGNSNVLIDGGTVSGFNDGILLYSSSSRVRGMTATGACAFGMAISGQENQVDTSVVTGSHLDGIGIGSASGIRILANDISGNFRVGVDISNFSNNNTVAGNVINNNGIAAGEQGGVAIFNGMNNVISRNTINNNFDGILIDSPGNIVEQNTVNGSVGNGASGIGISINVSGASTIVRGNTVLGSSFDMSDGNPGCGTDQWTNNTFQTAAVVGGSAGCIQ